jgi:DNA-binding protein H-NS
VKTKAKAGKVAPTRTAKYSDGQGNSWSGVGKRPYWLRDALLAGSALEEFATEALPPTRSAKLRMSRRRKSKVVYRDQAGHAWSGMGPRPRWLKEALEAGKTLEAMTA